MRINILHNTYQQAGGEDVVVANEEALLRKYGHEVHLHRVSNDSIQGLWIKAVTAWQTHYSGWGRREAMRIIEKTRPPPPTFQWGYPTSKNVQLVIRCWSIICGIKLMGNHR